MPVTVSLPSALVWPMRPPSGSQLPVSSSTWDSVRSDGMLSRMRFHGS